MRWRNWGWVDEMPKIVKKSRVTKGKMARELVYYCIWALTAALLLDRTCDLSDVLVFAGAAFGGELLLLLVKRVFAKPNDKDDGGTYDG